VNKLREYKIAFRGLTEGEHKFEYKLDSNFFENFEMTKGVEGCVGALVTLKKTSLFIELKIELDGSVKGICDHCLGDVNVPIIGETELFIVESGREEGNNDDFVVVDPNDDYIDISLYLYETYILNYPMKVVHKDGECDEDMYEILDDYIIEEEKIDPRWDELKKLINNE